MGARGQSKLQRKVVSDSRKIVFGFRSGKLPFDKNLCRGHIRLSTSIKLNSMSVEHYCAPARPLTKMVRLAASHIPPNHTDEYNNPLNWGRNRLAFYCTSQSQRKLKTDSVCRSIHRVSTSKVCVEVIHDRKRHAIQRNKETPLHVGQGTTKHY
jgi:hypothetical protein